VKSKHSLPTDGQISELRTSARHFRTALEGALGEMFQRMEDLAKALPPHSDPAKTFAAIYRWASVYYLRLAGVAFRRNTKF
jgi:hypothetical protein